MWFENWTFKKFLRQKRFTNLETDSYVLRVVF